MQKTDELLKQDTFDIPGCSGYGQTKKPSLERYPRQCEHLAHDILLGYLRAWYVLFL